MKKLLIAVLAMVLLLALSAVTLADDIRVPYAVTGGNIYFNPETKTIVGADSSITAAVVPSQINGVEVKHIGYQAFGGCSYLSTITISEGITTIDNNAFGYKNWYTYSCSSLVSVKLPESLTSIGDGAFYSCGSLSDINIPANVISIGSNAFEYCSSLASIKLPGKLLTINPSTFSGCKALNSVNIPAGVMSIGSYAFYECIALPRISIPSSVQTIGNKAFAGCSALLNVTIPSGVTSIGEYAFSGCYALTRLSIADSVTTIGNSAFSNCISLTTVTIPSSVTSISDYAFDGCKALVNVTIPYSVTTIGIYAFQNCTALTKINIPSSVTTIRGAAFKGCSALASFVIPASVTSISDSTFESCAALTNVSIPNSIKSIGANAFNGCHHLSKVSIPNSVKVIKDYAFGNDESITEISIPSSVETLGAAFYFSYNLADIYFGGTEEQWASVSANSNLGGYGNPNPTVHYSTQGSLPKAENMTDVKDYYQAGVDWAVSHEYVMPESDTLFGEGDCLRWQVVYIIWLANGSPEPTTWDMPFDDVPADASYYDAVCWAVEKGVTNGNGEGLFNTFGTVDRATAMAFIWKAVGQPAASGTNSFTDVSTADWYYDAILWAAANGYSDGTNAEHTLFSPKTNVTLAQMVTFLQRWDENN